MKTTIARSAAALSAALLLAAPAWATGPTTAGDTTAAASTADTGGRQGIDKDVLSAAAFAEKAGQSNLFEIQSSRLALDRSQDERVRDFAQLMIDDHTKAGDKLKAALADTDVDASLPQQLDEAHADRLDRLKAAQQGQFDQLYVKMQTEGHVESVKLFEDYAYYGENATLKAFADDPLPTLKGHLQRVRLLPQQSQS